MEDRIRESVGIVDADSEQYPPCSEYGERFYSNKWLVSAVISEENGLTVVENGHVSFIEHRPYQEQTAVIRIENDRETLRFYLNGRFVYQNKYAALQQRDLRGYYVGTVDNHRISIQQTVRVILVRAASMIFRWPTSPLERPQSFDDPPRTKGRRK